MEIHFQSWSCARVPGVGRNAGFGCISLLAVLFAVVALPHSGFAQSPIRSAAEVRALPALEAGRRFPVEIQGVVTYVDRAWNLLFVQDSSAGIFVYLSGAKVEGELRAGARVTVQGVTTPGDFVPSIAEAHIAVEGASPLPTAREPDPIALFSGRLDSQWVKVSGIVRRTSVIQSHLHIDVDSQGKRLALVLQTFPQAWLSSLPDSEIAATGVVSMAFNSRRQVIGVKLDVPGESFLRTSHSVADPFSLPKASVESLGQFSLAGNDHRVRIRGTVEARDTGNQLYVSEGTASVSVAGACRANVGDRVDVVGFPEYVDFHRTLADSICRTIGKGKLLESRPALAGQILAGSDVDQSSDTQNDLAVLETEATVVENTYTGSAYRLLLQSGNFVFEAALPGAHSPVLDQVEVGSRLRVSGMCVIHYDRFQQAQSFRFILRRPEDIAVLSRPSWWNARHTLWALLTMMIVAAAILFWVATLRRRVDQQTSILRLKLEREAKLEMRYRRLFEANLASVLSFRPDGRILDCNPAFARLVGVDSAADLIGGYIQPLLLRANGLTEFVGQVEHEGSTPNVELLFLCADGSIVDVMASGVLSETEAGDRVIQVTLIDVTAQRQFEKQLIEARDLAEAGSRMKSEFLANMSHEIRTPLNGALGMISLALSADINNEVREYLEMAQDSATHLLALLNDVLDYSKIEAGKLSLEKTQFEPREVFRKAARTLAVKAHEKKLELLYRVDDSVPRVVSGDPHRLQQVLLNLIGNAIKFTAEGQVFFTAEAVRLDSGQVSMKVCVKDSGPGIALDRQNSIFEPFTQADGSTTRKFGGTGLGLSISAQLVSMMGGDIWVESKPGEGSNFSFTSLLNSVTEWDAGFVRAGLSLLRSREVLLSIDNPVLAGLLSELVQSWGMTPVLTTGAQSVMDAVQSARQRNSLEPVVLFDARCESYDSFHTIEQLRASSGANPAVVALLDSLNLRASVDRCNSLQAPYLVKPLDPEELRSFILRVIMSEPVAAKTKVDVLPPSTPSSLSPLSVLLVEDNVVNQRLASALLAKAGHHVEVVSSGSEAVNAASANRYDLILMDVQMPDMDGFEATARIRRTSPTVPIVALTAHAIQGYRERCLAAGMNDYLTKPIDSAKLWSLLAQFNASKAPGEEALAR